ncbi:MAG: glycoside hydrolase family 3 N-terminal domain-containing protein [Christensenella sp.]|nr:glycoside hydrolase family 3 N-terminal domain-containing protein [Christensenella sp.]
MKKQKIVFIILLIFCLFFTCGCFNLQKQSSPTTVRSETEETIAPSSSVRPEPVKMETFTGRVWSVKEKTLLLRADDGMEYTIDSSGAEILADGSAVQEIEEGQTITATCSGVDVTNGYEVAVEISVLQDAPALFFWRYEDRAKELMEDMSMEEKVGQIFFARCPKENAAQMVSELSPGGYILFDRDFKDRSAEDVTQAVQSYRDASKIPMLIGVDEEGGTVVRASKYEAFRTEPFLSPQQLYSDGGMEEIVADTQEKAQLLLGLGINGNLAPVCDVSTNPDDYIYPRTFGQDAQQTAAYVSAVVETMNEQGIGCTLKHFPGYGDNINTHTGIAQDQRAYEEFVSSDFLPFEAGIKAGAGSILVSHNIVECMDQDYPASLSSEVHRVLREELGFDGVIMTDDLYMDAIRDQFGTAQAAVLAVQAGNDMIISTEITEQRQGVLGAVLDGTISEERIDESVLRILCWKLSLGIAE